MTRMFTNLGKLIAGTTQRKLASAALAVMALSPAAMAGDHGRYDGRYGGRYDGRNDRGAIDFRFGHGDVRIGIDLSDRDCAPPVVVVPAPVVERTERVWVDPVYRTVCDRAWVAPVTQDVCQRVWVGPVYQDRAVVSYTRFGRVISHERVCVSQGHYEDQHSQVVVTAGHWDNVDRQELIAAGHWDVRTVTQAAPAWGYDRG